MDACALVSAVTALSAAIAKGRTPDELALLAAVFTQLGDTLATIATHREICCPNVSAAAPAGNTL